MIVFVQSTDKLTVDSSTLIGLYVHITIVL